MFNTPLSIISFIFNWIATIITIACYLPQTIKTMKTKHTVSLSKMFFVLGFLCSVAWIIGAIFSALVYNEQAYSINNILLITMPVIVANIIGVICNIIVLVIKIKNIKMSKKLNISEQEYCDNNLKK